MNKNYFLGFVFFFLGFNGNAQNYEFYGVLKLNGKNENAISYRILFSEKNGKISGYSLTDITGDHETKNIIEGTYDAGKKFLKFKEKEIVYTKSPISDDLFCFVNFEGKINLSSKNPKVEGNFNGLFKNQTKCINGTLSLISASKVNTLLKKANNRIQKSKELDENTKKKYNPIQIFDSLQTNQLVAAQTLNVFMDAGTVVFEIWDNGIEDGDMINLYHNNQLVLSNFTVSKTKKLIEVKLSQTDNHFKIEALNEGLNSPNTAMIVLKGDKSVDFQSNLKKGEFASVTIIRSKSY